MPITRYAVVQHGCFGSSPPVLNTNDALAAVRAAKKLALNNVTIQGLICDRLTNTKWFFRRRLGKLSVFRHTPDGVYARVAGDEPEREPPRRKDQPEDGPGSAGPRPEGRSALPGLAPELVRAFRQDAGPALEEIRRRGARPKFMPGEEREEVAAPKQGRAGLGLGGGKAGGGGQFVRYGWRF